MKNPSQFYLPISTIQLGHDCYKMSLLLLHINYISTLIIKNVLSEMNGLSVKKEFTTHGDQVDRNAQIISKCKDWVFFKEETIWNRLK